MFLLAANLLYPLLRSRSLLRPPLTNQNRIRRLLHFAGDQHLLMVFIYVRYVLYVVYVLYLLYVARNVHLN